MVQPASRRGVLAAALLTSLACSGCTMHRHVVGLGPAGAEEVTVRQYYALFGIIRLNEVNVQRMTGDLTSYAIETEFSLVDLLLAPVLLPLTFTSRTVTVRT